MFRFRYLDDADQARWPDWYEVDMGAMHEMDSGLLMEWEEATGYVAMDNNPDSPRNIAAAAQRRETKAMLAVQWLAVRLSGDTTRWSDFRPKVTKIGVDPKAVAKAVEDPNPQGPATNRAARRAKASAAASSPRARKAAAPRRSAN